MVGFLLDQEIKLATAESCTAGLLVFELARLPGSGQAIDCGLAVYSPQAKNRDLGVGYELIEQHSLTREAVAEAMAYGAIANNDTFLENGEVSPQARQRIIEAFDATAHRRSLPLAS
ncbi:CinA family protein [Salinisphaera sp. SPP-AMP-43]|uniref:CinA family protein n=1 Tax=Salinisphaera sp. SPP-AMP-43 TaxID=3121288 RepID=UPI003C6E5D89